MHCLLDLNKRYLNLCWRCQLFVAFSHLVVAVFSHLVVSLFSRLATVNGWQRLKILQLRAK